MRVRGVRIFFQNVFGEEAWAGNEWRDTLKSQLSVLLECIMISQAKHIAKREGGIAPPKF